MARDPNSYRHRAHDASRMKWPPVGAPGPFPLDKLLLNDNSLPITLEQGGYRAPLWP